MGSAVMIRHEDRSRYTAAHIAEVTTVEGGVVIVLEWRSILRAPLRELNMAFLNRLSVAGKLR